MLSYVHQRSESINFEQRRGGAVAPREMHCLCPVRPAVQMYTAVPIIPEKLEEFKRVESRQLEYRSITDPRVAEQGPSPNPFARKLDLGGGRRG